MGEGGTPAGSWRRLRRRGSRPYKLLGLLSVVALLATACPEDLTNGDDVNALQRARDEGVIRAGFANEAPYGYVDEAGNVTGQSPEVARAIFARIGVEVMDGVSVDWDGLIPGLQAQRFDLIAAGMFITEERCEEVLFSDPDYGAPQAFAVQAGNPLDLNSYEDVAANPDARLGVMSGAVEEGYAEDSGVDAGQITALADPPSMIDALQADRVDAIALTSISIRDLVTRADDDSIEMVEPFVPVIDGEEVLGFGGYAFRYEDRELRDAFNEALHELRETGELLQIIEPFGFGQPEIDVARDVTMQDLCPNVELD